jgi:hypothetical protein
MRLPDRNDRIVDTHAKALQINLDARRYGTFAEIGAGQEVVRWFFRVGGAAGTVAKSMSAYDMTVSDAIYGKADRYVCRPRLQAMLDHEHQLNRDRLSETRGSTTAFFAFADTVSARNFAGTNECHGWMGVKFQSRPHDQDSQITIHVRMLDGTIEFRQVDNRLMSMKLVQMGLSGAAMFDPSGKVLQPSEVLHKKNVLVERGSFRPVCHVNIDMLNSARAAFERDLGAARAPGDPPARDGEIIELMELTMRNLREEGGEIDRADFLARADMLAASGKTVLISDYFEYYRLAAYLGLYTKQRIAITMGAASLRDLFEEKYYAALEGGILESFGRLFKNDLTLYIYPLLDKASGELTTVGNLEVAPQLRKLYGYLADRGHIKQLENVNREYLGFFSRDALRKIRVGDHSWEQMVPPAVAEIIKSRKFLGYRAPDVSQN